MTENFEGFQKETIDFLWELRFNNNKEWFDKNRERYKMYLKQPMDAFAQQLNQKFILLPNAPQTIPIVSRINRDIRFSKNKAPYKDHKWIVFKPVCIKGRWQESPAFYFELGPDYYEYGMGFSDTKPIVMQKFRQKIDANVSEFERLIEPFEKQKEFVLYGQMYKRKFSTALSEKVMQWYQRKSFGMNTRYPLDDTIFSTEIINKVEKGFSFLIPYYRYIETLLL